MCKSYKIFFVFLFLAALNTGLFYFYKTLSAAGSDSVIVQVKISVCGNSEKEYGEQCDGVDLGGATCVSRGFLSGTLACSIACEYTTAACVSGPSCGDGSCNNSETCSSCSTDCGACPPSGGGGGGGGGGGSYSVTTAATFSGRAFPASTVTLLKDAQVAATTKAGADATFNVSLSGLSSGNYIFSVYTEDKLGNRSSLMSFPVSVTVGVTNQITGIFISPTVAVDKIEVVRGDNVAIFGQSVPRGDITVVVNSDSEFFGTTKADATGVYLYNFDTAHVELGQHFTKTKAAATGAISAFSRAVTFTVGTTTTIALPAPKSATTCDLNADRKVNLIDFSIEAYWYKRSSPSANVDFNGDNKVDLVDFSIMAYHWTG